MKKPFTSVAIVLLSLISLIQLLRVAMGWEVTVAGVAIPPWASVIAFIVTGGLAIMLRVEARK